MPLSTVHALDVINMRFGRSASEAQRSQLY